MEEAFRVAAPAYMTTTEWQQAYNLTTFLLLMLLAVSTFGGCLIMAHIVIPSLRNSGQIPAPLYRTVQLSRAPLYILGLAAFAALVFLFTLVLVIYPRLFADIWPRWLI